MVSLTNDQKLKDSVLCTKGGETEKPDSIIVVPDIILSPFV
jgi:hypothetical protein